MGDADRVYPDCFPPNRFNAGAVSFAMVSATPTFAAAIWSQGDVRDIERSWLGFDRRGPTLPCARNLSAGESRVELSGVKMYEEPLIWVAK